MKTSLALLISFGLGAAGAAQAQSTWNGAYLGGHAGPSTQSDARGESILFDTNLDGVFGDTVRTAAGADAFSPGFCGGGANGPTPASGCRSNGDDDNDDYGLRLGYDWQDGALVYGVLGEVARGGLTDSVTAFSTTPAFYTMRRELETSYALRGRVGLSFGDDRNLLYATAGYAWASVRNDFSTSNGVNTFVANGDSDASGAQVGLGYERRIGDAFSVGLEYLRTDFEDEDYRVRAQGPAAATNPFLLVNPDGTDFRRSNGDIEVESVRLTLNYRF
ncbi:outer membrane beta-barrel protein [Arenimonas sp.]|uniref:outer membrane protein n=1 Tax=Arenimonas sp. TaxID=1872635 RepID=UPI0025C724C5|nr:outer membrane beta-barrel protein [Arenimonas sp.]